MSDRTQDLREGTNRLTAAQIERLLEDLPIDAHMPRMGESYAAWMERLAVDLVDDFRERYGEEALRDA